MMVEDDHINAFGPQPRNFREGRRAAVDGHQQMGAFAGQAPPQPVLAQAVTFITPMGQKRSYHQPELPQNPGQNRERSDAIDIVIAVQYDPLTAVDRLFQPGYGFRHVGQRLWGGQVGEFGAQEFFQFLLTDDAALGQQGAHECGQAAGGGGLVYGFLCAGWGWSQQPFFFHRVVLESHEFLTVAHWSVLSSLTRGLVLRARWADDVEAQRLLSALARSSSAF